MDDAERLEAIEEALDRLRMLSSDHVILVEGSKDVSALEAVGVTGDMYCVQSGGGPVRAAEYAWRRKRPAVIMTDWDGRGGNLAGTLADNLDSLGVRWDGSVRRDLSALCRPFCKDVESLDSVVSLLSTRAQNTFNGEGLRRRDGRIHRHRGHRRFGEDHGLQVRRGVPPQGGIRRGGHRGAHP